MNQPLQTASLGSSTRDPRVASFYRHPLKESQFKFYRDLLEYAFVSINSFSDPGPL